VYTDQQHKIAVIGLGYVGLPLALEFARLFSVVGFDIDRKRIEQLKLRNDETLEVDLKEADAIKADRTNEVGLYLSSSVADIQDCNIYIVTVPTPIDSYNVPNLQPLKYATELVANCLKKSDIVIYESTVYPGCTEEECVPLLEEKSGLRLNKDFFIGYSPERINPGDKVNTLVNVVKITSGSDEDTASRVDELYRKIIKAGTFKAASIRVAEAAKAIENAQRDVNISFVNELALIFDRIGIDTQDVLDAAATKYNFLPFKPGLVGGHCISVDPFYLAHKASQVGYQPNVILSGRRVNEQMASFVASKVVKLMSAKDILIKGARALILGITFKENCPDIRNSKVIDIYRELQDYGIKVDVYDPWASPEKVRAQFDIDLLRNLQGVKYNSEKEINKRKQHTQNYSDFENVLEHVVHTEQQSDKYDAIILAVAHKNFNNLDITELKKDNAVIFDTKGVLDRNLVDSRL